MVQKQLLNLNPARTACVLSGARRVTLLLVLMVLTAATAWATDVTDQTTSWTDGNTYNVTSNVTIGTRITGNGWLHLSWSPFTPPRHYIRLGYYK